MKVQKLLRINICCGRLCFFSFMHVLGYLRVGDLDTLSFFIASGWLTSFFSRNLLLQLTVALVATNVLSAGNNLREGLETKTTRMRIHLPPPPPPRSRKRRTSVISISMP